MNPDRYRALALRTRAAVCLAASFFSTSHAQSGAARKTDKDSPGVEIVAQGALDSELQPPKVSRHGSWLSNQAAYSAQPANVPPHFDRSTSAHT